MIRKENTALLYIFYVLIIFTIIMYILVPKFMEMPSLYFGEDTSTRFNDGWTIAYEDQVLDNQTLPFHVNIPDGHVLTLTKKMPDRQDNNDIIFRTFMQSVRISFHGDLIYEMGTDNQEFTGTVLGEFFNFVKINPQYHGQEIKIELSSKYGNIATGLDGICIGSKVSCIYHLIENKKLFFILSIGILLIGAYLFMLYVASVRHKFRSVSILYLSIFSIIIGIWFLGQSQLLYIFTDNTYFITRSFVHTTILCPIAMSFYVISSADFKRKNLIPYFQMIYMGIYGVFAVVDLWKLDSYHNFVIVTASLIAVECVYFFFLYFREYRETKRVETKNQIITLSIFYVSVVVEVLHYLTIGHYKVSYFMLSGTFLYLSLVTRRNIIHQENSRRIEEEKTTMKNWPTRICSPAA